MVEIEWKDMKVEGHVVAADELHEGFMGFIRNIPGSGTADGLGLLRRKLLKAGVPYGLSERAADRMLQKARRAGLIKYTGGKWHRVKEA